MIPRVVLDTNVVVSALLKPQSLEDQVLRLALAGKLALCTSPDVLAEYARVLPRPKFKLKPREVGTILEELQRASIVFHPVRTLRISRHESDNRFYECAAAAQAAFLVTGNTRHFPKAYRTTRVVTARQLLELLASDTAFPSPALLP